MADLDQIVRMLERQEVKLDGVKDDVAETKVSVATITGEMRELRVKLDANERKDIEQDHRLNAHSDNLRELKEDQATRIGKEGVQTKWEERRWVIVSAVLIALLTGSGIAGGILSLVVSDDSIEFDTSETESETP